MKATCPAAPTVAFKAMQRPSAEEILLRGSISPQSSKMQQQAILTATRPLCLSRNLFSMTLFLPPVVQPAPLRGLLSKPSAKTAVWTTKDHDPEKKWLRLRTSLPPRLLLIILRIWKSLLPLLSPLTLLFLRLPVLWLLSLLVLGLILIRHSTPSP